MSPASPRDALPFTAPNGGPLRNTSFQPRFFTPAAESVGLTGLTPNDLRHTAASLAVAAGANVKAVQRMRGHASAAMTLDGYADLFENDLDQVVDRLDQAATRSAGFASAGLAGHRRGSLQRKKPRSMTWAFFQSRLTESNRRPTHYECVALAD